MITPNETVTKINNEIQTAKDQGVNIETVSDGYHCFGELYEHRMTLFAVIVKQNKSRAWKSKQHDDGTMFENFS